MIEWIFTFIELPEPNDVLLPSDVKVEIKLGITTRHTLPRKIPLKIAIPDATAAELAPGAMSE